MRHGTGLAFTSGITQGERPVANVEKKLMKRGKPIEEIDRVVTDRIDAAREERLEERRDEAAATKPRARVRGRRA
jgi:hypothetical protein